MNSKGKVNILYFMHTELTDETWVSGAPVAENMATMNKVVFRDSANASTLAKYRSLFPGIGFAAGYKVLQRVYKFGGQPWVNDQLQKNARGFFVNLFGEKKYKPWMQATAGSLVGIGEIALLPLDVLKIIMQTNPQSLAGKSPLSIFWSEGRNLYRGAGWTAARNAPGSFALFGANALVKERIFGLTDGRKATFWQTFVSSIFGAVASIAVSAPVRFIPRDN